MFWNGKVRKLEVEIVRLEDNVNMRGFRITELKAMVSSLKSDVSDRDKEISALKKQLRKQNSADILVGALEAVGIIPTEKKKDYHAEHDRLMQYNRNMMDASGQQQYNNGSLFGLGSIF